VFQGTHQVSENTTLSIFLHTQISKKGAATDLIHASPLHYCLAGVGRAFYSITASTDHIF